MNPNTTSTTLLDGICRRGVLVSTSVHYWRGCKRLNPEDLGLDPAHVAADGLFPPDGRFHCMPAEDPAPAIELFRHRFLHALRDTKHISPGKLADLLTWQHSGFHIHDGGEKPVAAHDHAGRKRLAEYLLRHPFSLQKITWNGVTLTTLPVDCHDRASDRQHSERGRPGLPQLL